MRYILKFVAFLFFKVFYTYKYVYSDPVNLVLGSLLGLFFVSFILLTVVVKLIEGLVVMLKPVVSFGRLVLSLFIIQLSKYGLILILDLFIVLHRIRFFFLLGASSYDPLTKIFFDSVSVLKGEFLMDFYNVSSKFIFSDDFNLPTSIFSKTPAFDSSKNFFYMQVFYNLFTRAIAVQQNVRNFYFFNSLFANNNRVNIVSVLNRPVVKYSRLFSVDNTIKLAFDSGIYGGWVSFICRIVVSFTEFFHFDFFLFLNDLNYFLINSTTFLRTHVLLLKYFRVIRTSMMFILVNLENDSFLHFINVTLYKLALRNYYTRVDWENLVNTYELSMTNSFAFNGDSRSDLIFILKISVCYGFIIFNYIIFYVISITFFLLKGLFYLCGVSLSFYKINQFWFIDLSFFITSFCRLCFEFYLSHIAQILNNFLLRLKLLFTPKLEDYWFENSWSNFSKNSGIFHIFNPLLIFTLLSFRLLNIIRVAWSFLILALYHHFPIIYMLFFCRDYFEVKLVSPQSVFVSSAFSDVYYNQLFKQVFGRLNNIGLANAGDQVLTRVIKPVSVILNTVKANEIVLLFNFFRLKFFVDYYLKFYGKSELLSLFIIYFINFYISQFFAFLLLFSSKAFYLNYNANPSQFLDFNTLSHLLRVNYKMFFSVHYIIGLVLSYLHFYFLGLFVKFWKFLKNLPLITLLKFAFFLIFEITLFLRKILFYGLCGFYGILFYSSFVVGFVLIGLFFVGVCLLFVNFFYIISLLIVIFLSFFIFFLFFLRILSILNQKLFSQRVWLFCYLFVGVQIRLYYFRYKLLIFLRGRNLGFLEILGIFFLVRNDLKRYEIIHARVGFQIFNSVTADIAVNEFLYRYLLNFEKTIFNQRGAGLYNRLPFFDFTLLRSKFSVPLEALSKFKKLAGKNEFSRVQLKKDIFPEFEYHKYLRSRDLRNLSLFRFRKSLEPVDLYLDPLLDELKAFDSNHVCSASQSFDFLKAFYVDDHLFNKLFGYLRYVFARKNLSFFYDNLDRLSVFRIRYAKLSPLFRYFYLKREKLKYLSTLYVFGNINPFTFSIVLNWIQNYKILRAVLTLYKSLDSYLLNHCNRVTPTFQLIRLLSITDKVCISLYAWLNLMFWSLGLLVSVYLGVVLNLFVLSSVGVILCLMRLHFIFPVLKRLNVYFEYIIRRPKFFTYGIRTYSFFNRYIWVLIVKHLASKLRLGIYSQLMLIFLVSFFVLVLFIFGDDLGIMVSLFWNSKIVCEIIADNVLLFYWLNPVSLELVRMNIFVITYLKICCFLGLIAFFISFVKFFFVRQLTRSLYTNFDFQIVNFWISMLVYFANNYFLSFFQKSEIVPCFLINELDLLIAIQKRENLILQSRILRRWTT